MTVAVAARSVGHQYENILANITPDEAYVVIANKILETALQRLPADDAEKIARRRDVAVPVAGDTFYALYSYAPLLKDKEQVNNEILRELVDVFKKWMETREYRGLRAVTRLDREASMVFAVRFAAVFLSELARMLPPNERIPSVPCDGRRGGKRCHGAQDVAGAVKGMVEKAFRHATEKAKQAVEAYRALHGLSKGTTPAELAFLDEDPDIDRVEFRTMIEVLGSIRKAMPVMFRHRRARSPRGMPYGYATTRNPERAVPRELALPDELFYMKIASGGFLAREKREPARGVMVVLLDRSGSMRGEKIAWAKAVALALAVKARREKIDYILIPFDYTPHDPMTINSLERIIKIKAAGGTNIARALLHALEYAEERSYKRANIIVITDGADDDVASHEDEILARAKAAKATIKVFYIKGENEALRRVARKTGGNLYTVKPAGNDALAVVKAA